jgi:alpha-tubulin suppressor-like RCC1 family protein
LGQTSVAITKDTLAPVAASALGWQQSSPTNASTLTASWSKSSSSDLSSQQIQFYNDSTCTTVSGSLINLTSSATQQAFTGADGGIYTYKVTSFDTAGNSSTSNCSGSIAVDTVAPVVTIAAPTAVSIVNSASALSGYPVSGTCESGGTVSVTAKIGASTVTPTTQPSCSSGSFSTTLNLAGLVDGTLTFTASQSDLAGNQDQILVHVSKDTQAPALASSLGWQQSSPTNATLLSATWSKSSSSDLSSQQIQFYSDSTCTTVSGSLINLTSSATQQAFTGADGGIYTYKVTSFDTAGNSSTSNCSGSIAVDTVAPVVTIAAPTAVSIVNSASALSAYSVSGACESGVALAVRAVSASVTVSANPQPSCSGGGFSTTLDLSTLADGTLTFTVSQTDLAGNLGQTSVAITKDTVAPVAASALGWQQSSPTNASTLTASWSKSSSSDLSSQQIQFYSDSTCATASGSPITSGASAVAQSFTTPSYYNYSVPYFTFSFRVTSTDASGNSSQSACSSALNVDRYSKVAITSPSEASLISSPSKAVSYSVTGTCEEGSAITVQASSGTVTVTAGAPTVCSGGTFSATVNLTSLADGTFTFTERMRSEPQGYEYCANPLPEEYDQCLGVQFISYKEWHYRGLDFVVKQTDLVGNQGQNSVSVIPSNTYTRVATGEYWSNPHSCAINGDGSLLCWGANWLGQVGDGTNSARSTPVVVDGGSAYLTVSAGLYHTCGITNLGTLKCWGDNRDGRLGDGTTDDRLSPTVVDSGSSYISISLGDNHSCGITEAGILKCWGENSSGQLGDGTTDSSSSPVVIDSGESYAAIATGFLHSCGITVGGTLKCWGYNFSGQVGDGTLDSRLSPVVVDPGESYQAVTAGFYYSCGITVAGVLKCWGANPDGRLGDGSTVDRSTPTVVDSGVVYASVAAGKYHTCGVTSAGVLNCWGYNGQGQLGDGTDVDRTSPVVVGSGYSAVATGEVQSCGITSSGSLRCWGSASGFGVGYDPMIPGEVWGYRPNPIAGSRW